MEQTEINLTDEQKLGMPVWMAGMKDIFNRCRPDSYVGDVFYDIAVMMNGWQGKPVIWGIRDCGTQMMATDSPEEFFHVYRVFGNWRGVYRYDPDTQEWEEIPIPTGLK
jgi:hypothetical protein